MDKVTTSNALGSLSAQEVHQFGVTGLGGLCNRCKAALAADGIQLRALGAQVRGDSLVPLLSGVVERGAAVRVRNIDLGPSIDQDFNEL